MELWCVYDVHFDIFRELLQEKHVDVGSRRRRTEGEGYVIAVHYTRYKYFPSIIRRHDASLHDTSTVRLYYLLL